MSTPQWIAVAVQLAVYAFWLGWVVGRSSGRKQILSMIEKQIHRVK
jgi:hypothetical protein